MKICLAGNVSNSGGIRTHLRGLASALRENGHEVSIIAFQSAASDPSASLNVALLDLKGMVVETATAPRKRVIRGVEVAAHLLRIRPDVYIACGTGFNLFLPALVLRGRCRLVFHEVMSGRLNDWKD